MAVMHLCVGVAAESRKGSGSTQRSKAGSLDGAKQAWVRIAGCEGVQQEALWASRRAPSGRKGMGGRGRDTHLRTTLLQRTTLEEGRVRRGTVDA